MNDWVDAESKLRGLDHKINNFISSKEPTIPNAIPANMINFMAEAEGTRRKRACNTLSEITINRFENVFEDPQARVIMGESQRGGLQTRTNAKDGFVCN